MAFIPLFPNNARPKGIETLRVRAEVLDLGGISQQRPPEGHRNWCPGRFSSMNSKIFQQRPPEGHRNKIAVATPVITHPTFPNNARPKGIEKSDQTENEQQPAQQISQQRPPEGHRNAVPTGLWNEIGQAHFPTTPARRA
ncbi:hypothetical protein [Streptomyces sp. T028]|uniref:hypothetical protein n=1 Tax=Streptomyces sp. T028 TaxID=3394379 RepID=UPI003A8AC39F